MSASFNAPRVGCVGEVPSPAFSPAGGSSDEDGEDEDEGEGREGEERAPSLSFRGRFTTWAALEEDGFTFTRVRASGRCFPGGGDWLGRGM